MKDLLNNTIFWFVVSAIAITALTVINSNKPEKPKPLPKEPVKSLVTCFVQGDPIFSGEAIGDIKIDNKNISFFSLELNTRIQVLNGSCIVLNIP
tara:strand:+ start:427 stop:711 length:285 start_codon:yes stop_codon:yes gene_type:complete